MKAENNFISYESGLLTGKRVLVFAPHPDDETFGCGGSLAIHAASGDPIKVVILTNGAKGDSSGKISKEAYVALRQQETINACAILGIRDTEFWGNEDRELADSQSVLADMVRLLKIFQPQLIYTPSPMEFHPDHRSAVFWLEKAVRQCDSDFMIAFYELNQPLIRVNTLLDITSVLEQKKRAVQAYTSQLKERAYGDICLSLNRFRSFTLPEDMTHAEGFCLVEADIIRNKGLLSIFFQHIAAIAPDAGDAILSCEVNNMSDIQSPAVSVIVPTYNRKTFLKDALKSIFAQTYQDFEIIVINDGGEDVSDVISALNYSKNIVCLNHENSQGPAAARNTGLKHAKGRYIAYLDDDDLYYPNHLETLISVLEQGKYKVAYTDSHEILQQWITDRYVGIGEKPAPNSDFDRQKLLIANYIPTLNIAHHIDVINEIGLFDESLPSHEDWDLWIRFSRKYEFHHIPKVTAAFTKRSDRTSQTTGNHQELLNTLMKVHSRYSHLVDSPQIFEAQKHLQHKESLKVQVRNFSKNDLASEYKLWIEYLETEIFEKEIYLAKAIHDKNDHIRYLEKSVVSKDNHIRNLDGIIADKEIRLNNKDTHIRNLEAVMDSKDIHIRNLETVMDSKDTHIRNLDDIIENRNSQIHALENTIIDKDAHITALTDAIRDKDAHIANLEVIILNKEEKIADLECINDNKDRRIAEILVQKDTYAVRLGETAGQVDLKETHIRNIEAELKLIKASKVWRFAEMWRKFFYFWLLAKFPLLQKSALTLSRDGFRAFLSKTRGYLNRNQLPVITEFVESDYDIWMKKHALTDEKIHQIQADIAQFEYKPKISIITPVYNVDRIWLEKAIESVINQLYPNWELCMVDDASPKAHIRKTLEKYAKKDKRIKVKYFAENQGMSVSYHEALKLATGEFAGTLDHDDELTRDALYENVKLLNQNPNLDMIYSDEDKLDIRGNRSEPFFKPDYSPDLLLCISYICHFTIFRREKLLAVGGFRAGYDGAQDYDIMLRFTENTDSDKIAHIPKILYHWRKIPGSAAMAIDAKNYAYISAKKALCDYLERNKIAGEVSDGYFIGSYRIRRKILQPDKVSIIVPFRDKVDLLKKCVSSVLEKTDYRNYEILLINNQSQEPSTLDYLNHIGRRDNIRIIGYDKPFDFSDMNNYAVSQADGRYILMLNNDTEVISNEWLSAMVEHGQRKEVGAVGAKLLYPNNTVQHAGVVMGLGIAGHAFKHFPAHDNGYFGLANLIRNYSAVTAACLLMRKEVFEELGGLDAENLKIAYSDVDLCLKAVDKGYRVVYTPYSLLYHHESVSRGDDNDAALKRDNPEKYHRVIAEREYMAKKWHKYIENDPYYNIHLTRERDDFSIRMNG